MRPKPHGFDEELFSIASDEICRMLRRCRTAYPKDVPLDGRRVLANLLWFLYRWYEQAGPIEAVAPLERAALHALYQLDGFRPDQIDEALESALEGARDLMKPLPEDRPMRRRRWPAKMKVVPLFPEKHKDK